MIGFLDKGKGTKLINCSAENVDIGLKSEGKNLTAINFKSKNNKIVSTWYEKWWMQYVIFPIVATVIGGVVLLLLF